MADKATNVIDAGKVIAGLMTSEPEPQTTEEPVEAEAAPVEESQDEDTINPSDVPYIEQELELKYAADIDEKAIRRASLEQKGFSDTNKQMLDAATKNILQPEQPVSSTTIAIDVEPDQRK